ncbi:MAG: hypothetical protein OEZ39_12340 [Gammaproteobacteria bacterium]|nr:hypothetical protein [Gammaproteobacteria bacterium]
MDKENKSRSRNVTQRDLIVAAIVVVVMLFIGWYKEAGAVWAKVVFSIIPILCLVAYLFMPKVITNKPKEETNNELDKSLIERVWPYFLLGLAIVFVAPIIFSILEKY